MPEIEIINSAATKAFCEGEAVIKITTEHPSRDYRMVTTRRDYEELLTTHHYTPLLYMLTLPQRLAYIFGCVNMTPNAPRCETFMFWWRMVGTPEWKQWFRVLPSSDEIYPPDDT